MLDYVNQVNSRHIIDLSANGVRFHQLLCSGSRHSRLRSHRPSHRDGGAEFRVCGGEGLEIKIHNLARFSRKFYNKCFKT